MKSKYCTIYHSLCLDNELKEVPVQFPLDESENSVVPSSFLQMSDVLLEPTSSSVCADEVCNDICALLASSKSHGGNMYLDQ